VDWIYRVIVSPDEDGLATPVTRIFRRISAADVGKAVSRFPDLTGGLETPAAATP
jgi:hypothetical protein